MERRDIVVIGGSAGAIEGVSEIVRALPPDFPAAVFVVVHFPGSAHSSLPRILSRAGALPARHAENEERIHSGRIYVAPPDRHLFLEDGNVRLSREPKENGHRPAIDPLFRSAAHRYGDRVVGVLLSGNLNDGTAGLMAIKQHDGIAVVQNPDTALYSGMLQSAIDRVRVDHVVPVAEMPALLGRLHAQQPQAEEVTAMQSPDAQGLWEHRENGLLGFRCRVGHALTEEALHVIQAEQLEAALWTALRALEEHSALSRRLAASAGGRGHAHSASTFTEQAMDAEHHASTIRTVLTTGIRTKVTAAAALEPA